MGTGILTQGQAALDFTLPDARTGQPFTLSEAWAQKNVVLSFFRGLW